MYIRKGMKLLLAGVCSLAMTALASCGNDDDSTAIGIRPDNVGTFIDQRDGRTYHWARYGKLDWMCENGKYFIDDGNKCTVIQDLGWGINDPVSKKNLERYGCLYTLAGAVEAAPEGWRVPTDADWQNLERHFGMSESQAAASGWRGHVAQAMMEQTDNFSILGIQCGGFYTQRVWSTNVGYRHQGSYGFFWTSTKDADKEGELYVFRKFVYCGEGIFRDSGETENQKMNVRYVRDAV